MAPGGVYSGLVFSDVNYPSLREGPCVRYDFKGDQIEVLGPVKGEGDSMNILFLFATGDNGFKSIMDATREKYPDAMGVMGLHWDTRYTFFGWPWPPIPVFQKVHSTLYGTAVRQKK
jgi:hypothetical protein